MKAIAVLFASFKPTTFKVNFAYGYKTFLPHHIASVSQHPLSTLQKRELKARKKEGLWWHVTTGVELSKSSVVRSWCRRRLRNAFTDALKKNGFDEFGRLVDPQSFVRDRSEFAHVIQSSSSSSSKLALTGSLRLHILPPLVAAKYALVCKEADGIVDILIEGFEYNVRSLRHSSGPPLSQQSSPLPALSSTLPSSNQQSTATRTASLSQPAPRLTMSRRQPESSRTNQPSGVGAASVGNQRRSPQLSTPHERVAMRRSQTHGAPLPTGPRKPNGPPKRHRVLIRRV